MFEITPLTPADRDAVLADLIDLLVDSVDGGASVGFLPPLPPAEARAYWDEIFTDLPGGERVLLAARVDGRIAGAVQLACASKPNAHHRAEVQKLLVHSRFRRQGLGSALMQAIEEQARKLGRTLLVLDTLKGDAAEQLYPRLGYLRAGEIPAFARSAGGTLEPTVIFYKILP
jgi:GNAT superfamily N-acetyltransferase